jgi:hypothetical protein
VPHSTQKTQKLVALTLGLRQNGAPDVFSQERLHQMSYKKLLVDNPICNRRFHITYDDKAQPVESVELKCPHCQVIIYHKPNHPECKLVREENLISNLNLSDEIVRECQFEDRFSQKSQPMT